ncbi:ImmA/IrrE family metallo-endopeptidase [Bacillus toyonensis]|uniref:spr1629 family repressor/antitoxin n=1 Tax=Bacillus toyonensis TaxID=155322 RepID=UPI00028AB715|nr:ImmA/IrrE family metallo-endopeptidase [Bacillus toyonensis]AFU16604.1 transcription regulator [Bacillus thuringiensis MC28]MED3539315.1 ImmA/IrrE family metallo-endopeptidase [Bacillus toyonensis]MEE2022150.1 ImmA/IrrE family metallo-endopeptidase [Bacillus toyonensis]
MFVGEKLANIRLLYGLSRQDLASKLGVTEQSIWQYEKGYTSPSLEKINDLKSMFHVRTKFFYTKDELMDVVNENNIAYRSEKNVPYKKRTDKIFLNEIERVLTYMEKLVSYPKSIVVDVRNYSIEQKNKHNFSENNKKEIIENIALKARREFGLNQDNNEDLMFLLEKKGVFVLEKALGVDIDGYSAWTNYDRPYIVLGNTKKSSVRRNFDLAHELGHLLLHYQMDIGELSTSQYNEIEQEAHMFASNFLMPKQEFMSDLQCISKISNPDHYIELKQKWKVSLAAMGHRAYSLGVMSYQQYRYFNVLLHRYGYKIKEPLDSEIPIIRPGKIRSIFRHVLDKKTITLEQLLKKYHCDLQFLTYLLNIELSFFEAYIEKKKDHSLAYLQSLTEVN